MKKKLVSLFLALVMCLGLVVPTAACDANPEKGHDGGTFLVDMIKEGLTNITYYSIELGGKTLTLTTGENSLGQTVAISESEEMIVIATEIDETTIKSIEIERSAQSRTYFRTFLRCHSTETYNWS